MVNFTKVFGCLLVIVYLGTPVMEGIAALHFRDPDLYIYNALMTTTYAVWAGIHALNAFTIFFFGRKIVKVLEQSLLFHQDAARKDRKALSQLKKTLGMVKPTVFMVTNVLVSACFLCLFLATARYYIWTSMSWSLLFHFGCNTFPSALLTAASAFIFGK